MSDGSLVEAGEFPWVVALGYLSSQYKVRFSCGGSLISETFVLTAAHCVKDNQRPVVARLGKVCLEKNDDETPITPSQTNKPSIQFVGNSDR